MILFLFLPEVNYEEIQLPWIQTGLISLNKIKLSFIQNCILIQ